MSITTQKIKTFVNNNKTELAYALGVAVGFVATAIIYEAYRKGEQWDRIDAYEERDTHNLLLDIHKVDGSHETISIWPTEEHLKTHSNY